MSNVNDFVIKNGVLEEYSGSDTAIVIPDGVIKISNCAFYRYGSLQSVVFPASVQEIGELAFFDCGLQSITFCEGIKKIGRDAFGECRSLQRVELPKGLTYIGDRAFWGCSSLQEVVIPESVTEIGWSAFLECDKLRDLFVPWMPLEKLKKSKLAELATRTYLCHLEQYTNPEIAAQYAAYASSKKKALLPDIFRFDLVQALEGYARLEKITEKNVDNEFLIPAQEANALKCVEYLQNWKSQNISSKQAEKMAQQAKIKDPFNAADMKKLWSWEDLAEDAVAITGYKGIATEITIPERIGIQKVTAIADEAFRPDKTKRTAAQGKVMNNLQRVIIPEGVTAIGDSAFYGCSSLQSIVLPESVTVIGGYAFCRCSNLQSIVIPKGMTEISKYAFKCCYSLQSVVLPEGVTVISEDAFGECRSIQSVVLPKGVKKICEFAFSSCSSLRSIVVPKSVRKIEEDAFFLSPNLTIHAPAGSYAETYAKENNIPFVAE